MLIINPNNYMAFLNYISIFLLVFVFLSKINRHSPLATPQKVSSLFNRYSYCSSKKAIEELGFPQTPIIESIKKAHSWFRQNNYIHD